MLSRVYQVIVVGLYVYFISVGWKRAVDAEKFETNYNLREIKENGDVAPLNYLSSEYYSFSTLASIKLFINIYELIFPFVLCENT
jgi:hypothetical protein